MTLEQTKTYVVGVLKGWFTNKKVLDGFSEDEAGKLLYKNTEIVGGSSSEEVNIPQAITETLAELNTTETPST